MFTRRRFVQGLGALAVPGCGARPVRLTSDPFTLGVASGYPSPSSVVLWTRLTGDLGPSSIPVRWEIATDDAMRTVVRSGEALAEGGWAHCVHAEVDGLQPDRWYWYRFRAGGAASPI